MNATSIAKPEEVYRTTTDKALRHRLQMETVTAMAPAVARLVRKRVRSSHWQEGEQVGAIGVLLALEKYDPGSAGSFRRAVLTEARRELQLWLDAGTYWRPKAKATTRELAFADTLTAKDRGILFSKGGRMSKRYFDLLERMLAFAGLRYANLFFTLPYMRLVGGCVLGLDRTLQREGHAVGKRAVFIAYQTYQHAPGRTLWAHARPLVRDALKKWLAAKGMREPGTNAPDGLVTITITRAAEA